MSPAPAIRPLERRVAEVDWPALEDSLRARGYAQTPPLLAARECSALAALFDRDELFRTSVEMERHRFGAGRYRYFGLPLPPQVAALRRALYPPLAAIANRWQAALGARERFPESLDAFLAHCAAHGQSRPTPLLLRYGAGGYNRLHQDRYGAVGFPLQATLLLSRPERDFEGGEFLLVEQRPRMQSRGHALRLERGAAVIFAGAERPVEGARGIARARMRHGVAEVRRGTRVALGVIFHDAA